MDEPVDAATDPTDATASDVLQEKLCRVARVGGLLGREVAILGARRFVECGPVRSRCSPQQ